eukprot:3985709-Amphidinium_carterae.1
MNEARLHVFPWTIKLKPLTEKDDVPMAAANPHVAEPWPAMAASAAAAATAQGGTKSPSPKRDIPPSSVSEEPKRTRHQT